MAGFNVFDSIWDTYDDRLNGRVYHAYANYHFCSGFVSDAQLSQASPARSRISPPAATATATVFQTATRPT